MDTAAFEQALRHDGFDRIETKSFAADIVRPVHMHPFEVRALVLSGGITLTVDGRSTAYRAGDVFTMAPRCLHGEHVGPDGITYMIGRRG